MAVKAQGEGLGTSRAAVTMQAVLVAVWLIGCSGGGETSPGESRPDAGTDTGSFCPDPEDPRVTYREDDPARCAQITLSCTEDQNGFDNACGCGCIEKGDPLCPPVDDPAVTWVSRDPAECTREPPICPMGENPFSSSCGCGCTMPGS
jgi:hypothetical protein